MKLSTEHVQFFKTRVLYWQKTLNLDSWRMEFLKKGAGKDVLAQIHISYEDRLCSIQLGSGWKNPTWDSLDETAFHELLHTMLVDLKESVKAGHESMIIAAEHSIITVLEKILRDRKEKCSSASTTQSWQELLLPSLPLSSWAVPSRYKAAD